MPKTSCPQQIPFVPTNTFSYSESRPTCIFPLKIDWTKICYNGSITYIPVYYAISLNAGSMHSYLQAQAVSFCMDTLPKTCHQFWRWTTTQQIAVLSLLYRTCLSLRQIKCKMYHRYGFHNSCLYRTWEKQESNQIKHRVCISRWNTNSWLSPKCHIRCFTDWTEDMKGVQHAPIRFRSFTCQKWDFLKFPWFFAWQSVFHTLI